MATREKHPNAKAGHDCDTTVFDSAIVRAFQFLGKRWNGLILARLGQSGPVGFSDLKRGVGKITDSVLSDRLSELAGAGLIARSVSDTRPPTVTYALTPEGERLTPVLEGLASWAETNLPPEKC